MFRNNQTKRSLFMFLLALAVVAVFGLPAAADTVESTAVAVTQSDDYDTSPTLGVDATSEMVVYTSQVFGSDGYGPGDIMYQRLDTDGTTIGEVIKISDGTTDDQLNDVSGSRVVYTAHEGTTFEGKIMLYDLAIGATTELMSEADTVWEARIDGDIVVWVQGQSGDTRVNYFDLRWPSGTTPLTIGGPNPPCANVDIGSHYVVWEQAVDNQNDIAGYDIYGDDYISVSADADLDERTPATFGEYVVWQAIHSDGSMTLEITDMSVEPADRYTAVNNGSLVYAPSIYENVVAYEAMRSSTSDLDIYLYRISDMGDFTLTDQPDNQYLNNIFGDKVAYVDAGGVAPDVWVSTFNFVSNQPGELCDDLGGDDDGDGVCQNEDNCPGTANPTQGDMDGDGYGDVCDNCPRTGNLGQKDTDKDGLGDACDDCPEDYGPDPDRDLICTSVDNCPDVANQSQNDIDGDGMGDACDDCPVGDDTDDDGVCDVDDNCLLVPNPLQTDTDGDGIGDECDNAPPVADAGPDQPVIVLGTEVTLDGTDSYDPDGPSEDLTYSWTMLSKPAGSSAALDYPTSDTPTFVADVQGDYEIELVVSDPWDSSDPDTVTVSFENITPVADAGEDVSMFWGESVVLYGSATDPSGDPVLNPTWSWTIDVKPAGSIASLSYPTTQDPVLFPDLTGDYLLSLVVSDGAYESLPDSITVHVALNLPPVAIATADVTTGTAPLTVNFDGSQSYDPEGGPVTYLWMFGDPLSDEPRSYEIAPTHVFEWAGTYLVSLYVEDDLDQPGHDSLLIEVLPGGNIKVSPAEYDFGDVELGSLSSTIITITNPLGGYYEDPLIIEDISFAEGGSASFAVTANPVGLTVEPGESVDVGITFTPLAEDYISTTLEIESDDPVFGLIEVALGGEGVFEELPPEGQIAAILSFINASVTAGSLAGDGPGSSAENRLNALQNMIEASGDLIEDELYEEACGQLAAALKKCDGQPNPPDFVTGPAALVLRSMIEVLRTTLGCE